MLKINTYPKAIAAFIITLIILSFLLSSCYNQKKAVKQAVKAMTEYPDTTGAIFREEFPCVPVSVDSTGFKESIAALEKQLDTAKAQKQDTVKRLQEVTDSLKKLREQMTADDCPTLLENAEMYGARMQVENEQLKSDLSKKDASLSEARRLIKNIKPIKETVEDSSKIWAAIRERDRVQKLYDIDHAWRTEREAKDKGKVLIRIPEWIIIVLLIIGGLSIVARIWKKSFNPLSLLFK